MRACLFTASIMSAVLIRSSVVAISALLPYRARSLIGWLDQSASRIRRRSCVEARLSVAPGTAIRSVGQRIAGGKSETTKASRPTELFDLPVCIVRHYGPHCPRCVIGRAILRQPSSLALVGTITQDSALAAIHPTSRRHAPPDRVPGNAASGCYSTAPTASGRKWTRRTTQRLRIIRTQSGRVLASSRRTRRRR
jgi:hypothetical protein